MFSILKLLFNQITRLIVRLTWYMSSGGWYLSIGRVCRWRFRAGVALVRGNGVDGLQDDGVLLLQHVSVVDRVFQV